MKKTTNVSDTNGLTSSQKNAQLNLHFDASNELRDIDCSPKQRATSSKAKQEKYASVRA